MYAVNVQYTLALLLHTGGHLGRDKTYDKIAAKFYWKNMYEDVTSYVRRCHLCQTTNDKFTKPKNPTTGHILRKAVNTCRLKKYYQEESSFKDRSSGGNHDSLNEFYQ